MADMKLLHELLPDLVPPIDRTYPFNFLYNKSNLSVPEEIAFHEMFTRIHRVAKRPKKSENGARIPRIRDSVRVQGLPTGV